MMIFVTGGASYIGSHTVLELLNLGYDVVAADNFINSKAEVLNRVRRLSGRDFAFYDMDIRDETKLEEVFKAHKFAAVIHLAALKAVGESVEIPLSYYENNLGSTITLCKIMEKYGVTKLIFSSSAAIYSEDNELPLTEDSKVGNCTNPYAWSKYMCEQILKDIAQANGNWSVIMLRYFNVIGADKSGDIGEDPQGIPNNIMPYIAQTAVGRREFLSVFGSDYDTVDGTGVRDYIHVTDVAKGHVASVEYSEKHKGSHIFNLGTGRGSSVLELVKAFEEAAGFPINKKFMDRRPGDLAVCYATSAKAERELNWRAEKTIEDAARDTWRWQSKNPNGYEV